MNNYIRQSSMFLEYMLFSLELRNYYKAPVFFSEQQGKQLLTHKGRFLVYVAFFCSISHNDHTVLTFFRAFPGYNPEFQQEKVES